MKKGLEIKQLLRDHPGRMLAYIWQDVGVELTVKGEILTFGEKVYVPKGMTR